LAARALARAATVQAAALHMLDASDADFLAVHFALPAELRRIGDARVHAAAGQAFVLAAIKRLHLAAPDRSVAIIGHGPSGEAGVLATRGVSPRAEPMLATSLATRICGAFGVAYAPAETPPPQESVDPRTRGYAPPPGPPVTWQASRLAFLARMLLSRAPATSRQLVEQALAVDPGNVDALRVQALYMAGAEDVGGLEETGARLCERAPGAPWGPLALALGAALAGNRQRATALLDPLDGGADEMAWSIIGAAWLVAGDTRRAEAAFANAPNRTDAALGLARAAIVRRKFAQAETILCAALVRNPVSQPAQTMLGELYSELGRAHEAEAARQRAAALAIA
jgi:hypothetical protein